MVMRTTLSGALGTAFRYSCLATTPGLWCVSSDGGKFDSAETSGIDVRADIKHLLLGDLL